MNKLRIEIDIDKIGNRIGGQYVAGAVARTLRSIALNIDRVGELYSAPVLNGLETVGEMQIFLILPNREET
jgi:hypothetical protein